MPGVPGAGKLASALELSSETIELTSEEIEFGEDRRNSHHLTIGWEDNKPRRRRY
jgi:hypothetical protein